MYPKVMPTVKFHMFTLSTDSEKVAHLFGCSVKDLYLKIFEFTSPLKNNYPSYKTWFFNSIIPNSILAPNREIVLIIFESSGTFEIAGLTILKNDEEKKLCTIIVKEKFRKLGMATLIFKKSFLILGTDKPLLTVSEDGLDGLMPLIKKFKFNITSVIENAYQPGKKEYIIN